MTPRPPLRRGTLRWGLTLLTVALSLGGETAWAASLHPRSFTRWLLLAAMAWLALSLASAAGLYVLASVGRNPGDVLKGHRWPVLQPVFLPFRAVSWVVFHVARLVRHARPASEVAQGLFVGPRPVGAEPAALAARGVRAVLDLAAELPTSQATGAPAFDRLQIPLLDRTGPEDVDMDRAVAWVLARTQAGHGVLVHCAFGRGRSGLVACAVVLARGLASDPEAARALVTRARPSVQVQGDQYEALRRFHARWRTRGRMG